MNEKRQLKILAENNLSMFIFEYLRMYGNRDFLELVRGIYEKRDGLDNGYIEDQLMKLRDTVKK